MLIKLLTIDYFKSSLAGLVITLKLARHSTVVTYSITQTQVGDIFGNQAWPSCRAE